MVESIKSVPPEWGKHQGTWMSWPFGDDIWFDRLAEVRREYGALVRTILEFEPVRLVVKDSECRESIQKHLGDLPRLSLFSSDLDDVWIRDNGPIFTERYFRDQLPMVPDQKDGRELVATCWGFNAWGGKYPFAKDRLIPEKVARWSGKPSVVVPMILEGGSLDHNGENVCLTTKQCLMSQTRNPNLSMEQIQEVLREHLGVQSVIWLNEGLEGDHTDGHVDTITRFVDSQTIVHSMAHDPADPNWAYMEENMQILQQHSLNRVANGLPPFKIVPLPLPQKKRYLPDGTRMAPSYANFYVANGVVVVPQYGDPQDTVALGILKSCFSRHKVIGLSSEAIILGGGSFHCLTQQEPSLL